ncbi:MAG: SGNH/GDSL hydrolase family protein [Planctomycetes bacterium]|nr:SGNH/GDSL hydrolase family protein [Planctomycetota bacterium]
MAAGRIETRTRWPAGVLKSLAGVALALVFFELTLALLWPQERETPLFDTTEALPLVLRKNLDGRHVSREFSVRYRTNSHRLRDPERPLGRPAGVRRILVLGDSLTFGSGVNDEDTFVRQLERRLNASADGGHYEVINAACASWGTAHHLVFLEELGWKFEPDLVLMAFHDDDPKDNRLADFVHLEEDGRFVLLRRSVGAATKWTARIPLYAWLAQHSHLFSRLRLQLAQWVKNRRAAEPRRTDFLAPDKLPEAVWPEADWRLTERLLAALADRARAHGAKLALLHVPFPRYNRAVERRYVAMAEALSLPHLELIDLLDQHNTPADPTYFPVNRHFTPKGHRLIAEALAAFLARESLLPH